MQPSWNFMRSHPAYVLALGFGSGLSPKAPGTMGTLAAFPLYALMLPLSMPAYWAAWMLFFLVGIWLCAKTGQALGEHDHGGIVWDEITAFLLVLPLAPATWWGYLLAFSLFRLFDIWKPFPIGWLDRRIGGGLGVMLDDILAAGYAVLCLLGVEHWT